MSGISKYALVMAGGMGTRIGASVPKQLLPLKEKPILAHTLAQFLNFDSEPELIVCCVLHASIVPYWKEFVEQHFELADHPRILYCEGGDSRTRSVQNGLEYLSAILPDKRAFVAIHDGVRPFIDNRIISEGFAQAEELGNAVAGVQVKSSLRMRTDTGSTAIDRSKFFEVQTPQVFELSTILDCYHRKPAASFTDDASLAEAMGENIHLYLGSYENIKITTLEDLLIAERILEGKKE